MNSDNNTNPTNKSGESTSRRNFLTGATTGFTTLGASMVLQGCSQSTTTPSSTPGSIVITRIEAIPVAVPWKMELVIKPEYDVGKYAFSPFSTVPKCILKIYGDNGLMGVGETKRGYNVEGVQQNINFLTGKNVFDLNFADSTLGLPHSRTIWAFEMAIYDLIGKTWGVPVWQLLGGKYQDKVAVSCWTGRWDGPGMERVVSQFRDMGYQTIKFKGRPGDPIVDEFKAINRAAPDMKIICDINTAFETPDEFIRFAKQIEDYNVEGIEDPIPIDLEDYARLRERINVPLAITITNPATVIEAAKLGSCDIINLKNPLRDFVKLTHVADAAGFKGWHGSGLELGPMDVSFVHAAAATPNCTVGSDILGHLIRVDDVLSKSYTVENGYASVPNDPGLGCVLDEDALEKYRVKKY
ncbi:mandelate racemase/muconate lactonizing enzyme family protein [Candidatus Latescibacterota bacterium]